MGQPRESGESARAGAQRRLFFALWLDAATRTQLAAATRTAVQAVGGAAVAPADLHLTLAFLGNLPDALLPVVLAAGKAVAPVCMTVRLDRLRYHPESRLLWIEPSRWPAELDQLVLALRSQLRAAGLEPDLRNFLPHVTLSRRFPAQPALSLPAPILWPVSEFVLAESTRTGDSRYVVVARYASVAA